MATKTSIQYVSDLSGKVITDNDAPTVAFGYDGTDYTIDLTAKEAEAFYKAMATYIDAGTKVSKSKTTRKNGRTTVQTDYTPSDVRAWAQDNGIDVPARGRIPATVVDAYNAR